MMIIKDKTWIANQQRYEKIKQECDEISYIALAFLLDKDFKMTAKVLVEMAKLYAEVNKFGAQDFAAIAYNKYGFDRKVRQIISIASEELKESDLKVYVDIELQLLRSSNILILPAK